MIPSIVISYVDQKGNKIAKAAFVNESDALIYWNALQDSRRRYLVMETLGGEPVLEIAHTGFNGTRWGGYFSHAYAITESKPLPPRSGATRDDAVKYGWEFEKVVNDG